MLVSQGGCYLRVKGCAGNLCIREDGGDRNEVLQALPHHPNPAHVRQSGDPSFVLPRSVSDLVLQRMELPGGADAMTIYVGEAFAVGDDDDAFVRVVWFTPQAADAVTGRSPGSHARDVMTLCSKWQDTDGSNRTLGGVQPASGRYCELGLGSMPGSGRGSVQVGDGRSVLPFPRNPDASDVFEPMLSNVLSDVSVVLHHVLPEHVLTAHMPVSLPSTRVADLENAYQYPRLREDAGPLRSHQVVLRGPSPTTRVCDVKCDADTEAWLSASDLHVDSWDGGGSLGTCTVHTCSRRGREGEQGVEHEERNLECRGMAVFPRTWGGRGVHVLSMVPGWHCAILMRTSDRLHSSVLPNEGELDGFGLPHLDMLRIVTYPIRRIERMLERLTNVPWQVAEVVEASHAWVRARMRQDHTATP